MNLDFQVLNQESYCIAKGLERVVSSAALLGEDKSIVILHGGERYILSITKLRKLILTK
ncbi:hemin uptake protein HemP [Polynucleobacter sp. UK-Mo-2m-Kol15]|uniref:hemin uptake protein HemP n=1 Tax=Polynucleobacter sp. UK-Mo-2m-Kol15 TaxID=2576916 RepID=UPI00351CEC0B